MGKNIISKLTSDTFFYGITNYLSVIVGVILLPIYTRIFSKEDYGVLEIFNVWNNFFIMVLPLGFYSGILRFFPDYKKHEKMRKIFAGTILNYFIFIAIVFLAFMILTKQFVLLHLMNLSNGNNTIYILSVFIVIEVLFLEYLKSFFRMQFQRNYFLIVSFVNFIILSVLGFSLVYYYNFGVKGFFIASFIALTLSNLIGFYLFRGNISFSFNKKIFNKIFFYSIHFMSVSLLFKATDLIDRYLLNSYFSLASVGEYAIAVKIASFYNIALSAVAFAWMPYVLSIKNEEVLKKTIKIIANLFIVISILLISIVLLFQNELLDIFAPNYILSKKLIPVIISYLFLNGFVYFFTLGIQIKNYTKVFSYTAVLSVFVNISSSILLSKYFQEVGIALGSLLGSFIWVLFLFYFSQKRFKINFDYKLILSFLILFIGIIVSVYIVHSVIIKILLALFVLLIVFITLYRLIPKTKIVLDV